MNTKGLAERLADDILNYIKNHPNEVSDRDIMIKFIQKGLDIAVDYTIEQCYSVKKAIDEGNLDELAYNDCINRGYAGLDEEAYIDDFSLTWGDFMKDIRNAFKAGYHKAMGK